MSKTDDELRRNILNVRHKSCNDWLILRECQDCEIEVDAIMALVAAERSRLLERVLGEATEIDYHSAIGDIIGHNHDDLKEFDGGYNKAMRTIQAAIRRLQGEGEV